MTLGAYLKELRGSRGLMQKQLAADLGIGASYISNLEKGVRVYLGDQMLTRLRQVMSLTDAEYQRLRELRDVASGKLSIPPYATEEEIKLFRLLISCTGRVPNGQIEAVRGFLESWLRLTEGRPAIAGEERHMI